jgi:hypothetical protein
MGKGMVWVIKSELGLTKQYTSEEVDVFKPRTWEEVETLLKDYPRITTAYIYTDEQQESKRNSDSIVFSASFPGDSDDFKLLGGLYDSIELLLKQHKEVFVRAYPEITLQNYEGERKKYVYARFIFALGD